MRACSEGVITRGFQPLVPGSNPGGRTRKPADEAFKRSMHFEGLKLWSNQNQRR